jgi:hypothetical protein
MKSYHRNLSFFIMLFTRTIKSLLVLSAVSILSGCGSQPPAPINTDSAIIDPKANVVDPVVTHQGAASAIADAFVVPTPGASGVISPLPAYPSDAVESTEKHNACMRAARLIDVSFESYCKTNQDGEEVCQWMYESRDGEHAFYQGRDVDCDKTPDNVPLNCETALSRL